jgi:hypothetical protein
VCLSATISTGVLGSYRRLPYRPFFVERCGGNINWGGVFQERSGVRHALHILFEAVEFRFVWRDEIWPRIRIRRRKDSRRDFRRRWHVAIADGDGALDRYWHNPLALGLLKL